MVDFFQLGPKMEGTWWSTLGWCLGHLDNPRPSALRCGGPGKSRGLRVQASGPSDGNQQPDCKVSRKVEAFPMVALSRDVGGVHPAGLVRGKLCNTWEQTTSMKNMNIFTSLHVYELAIHVWTVWIGRICQRNMLSQAIQLLIGPPKSIAGSWFDCKRTGWFNIIFHNRDWKWLTYTIQILVYRNAIKQKHDQVSNVYSITYRSYRKTCGTQLW